MHAYIQWALAIPQDWQRLELRVPKDWRDLPKKDETVMVPPGPVSDATLDQLPGWVAALNVQGVIFEGLDAFAVTPSAAGLIVTAWTYTVVGERYAMVWTMNAPGFDSRYGANNTHQSLTVYDERVPSPFTGQSTSDGPVIVRPWSEFSPPAEALRRYGIWMSDESWAATQSARSFHGWQEW